MPGSTCVITVNGSFIKSDKCDRNFYKVSDTFEAEQELTEIAMATEKNIFPLASRSESKEYGWDSRIDRDTVNHQAHPTDSGKAGHPKMHFGLNNAGIIHQRMTQSYMRNQIGGN